MGVVMAYAIAAMTTDRLWAVYNETVTSPDNEQLLIDLEAEIDRRAKRGDV